MRKIIIFILTIVSVSIQGQNLSYWERITNWDGHTPWQKYIIISPGFMGPNALPVPETRDALIGKDIYFQTNLESYFGFGDFTTDALMKLYVPLAKNVAVESFIVPIEYYKLDTIVRNERRVRQEHPEGVSGGDFYFGTVIQICKDHDRLPDITLSLNFKTASGLDLDAARYTNAPGYYFDLSFGKDLGNSRLSGMIGFYSWQTYDELHLQNDAILYGTLIQSKFNKYLLSNSLRGYYGYLNNGDRPLIYKCNLVRQNTSLDYGVYYQVGLNDFGYQNIGISFNYHVSSSKLIKQ